MGPYRLTGRLGGAQVVFADESNAGLQLFWLDFDGCPLLSGTGGGVSQAGSGAAQVSGGAKLGMPAWG